LPRRARLVDFFKGEAAAGLGIWAFSAVVLAWPIVSLEAGKLGLPVYAPWMFGCGLAGGDWSVVKPLIESLCPKVIWTRRETGRTWENFENYRGF